MPEGDVKVTYELIPSASSIRAAAEQIVDKINTSLGKGKYISEGGSKSVYSNDAVVKPLDNIETSIVSALTVFKGIEKFLFDTLEPIFRPLLKLMQVLVLIIFLPLLPLIKLAMAGILALVKVLAPGSKPIEGSDSQYQGVGGSILDFLRGILVLVGAAIGGLLGSVFGPGGIALGATLGALVADFLFKLAKGLGEFLGDLVLAFFDFIRYLKEVENKIIVFAYKTLIGFGKWVWDNLTLAIGNLGEIIGDGIGLAQWLWDEITSAFGNIPDVLSGLGNWLLTTIKNAISSAVSSLGNLAGGGGTGGSGGGIISGVIDYAKLAANRLSQMLPFASKQNDFIMRPGQGAIPFSSQDTVVGFKGKNPFGGNGGVTYSPVYNIQAGVDSTALKKAIEEENRKFLTRLRSYGTLGSRTFNA